MRRVRCNGAAAVRADTRTRALVILLALGVLTPPAWAQESVRKGDVEVGMDIGWTGFHSPLITPNGSRLSAYGGYFLTRGIELVADITCLGGDERAPTGSPTFTMCTGSLGGALHVPVRPNLVPYARLSVGQAQLDRGAQAGVFDIEDRSAALHVAVGSRIAFGKRRRVAVRVDALWTRNGLFDHWATHTSLALGVIYRIAPSREQ
jgi:hypothetical protein